MKVITRLFLLPPLIFAVFGFGLALSPQPAVSRQTTAAANVETCFTPGERCAARIAAEMDAAKREILIQAYGFTSKDLAAAAMKAVKRGVKIRAILDKSNRSDRYSAADFLAHAGAEVLIDAQHAIAHNKIMIIDGEIVITGSYNFTKAAEERNAENVLIIRSPDLAGTYTGNWKTHSAHSEAYAGRGN